MRRPASASPHRTRPKHHARSRGSARQTSYIAQLVIFVIMAAAAVFGSDTHLKALWNERTQSSEQIAALEGSAYYRNCSDARAAGVAPISRGEPGYREEMDGDGDGVACEPYRGF